MSQSHESNLCPICSNPYVATGVGTASPELCQGHDVTDVFTGAPFDEWGYDEMKKKEDQ